MSSIRRRLEILEEITAPQEFPGWRLEEQVEDVLDKFRFYQRFHANDPVRYAATDREIHLLGLVCAFWELPDGVGEYRYPSGAMVEWADEDGMRKVDGAGYVSLEDLPEDVRKHFENMAPEDQPARDARLYEMWRHERGVVR